jgi:L-lactate dehydrogenase (cytochrome)
MSKRLERCNNVADLRALAKKRLPAPMFHYIAGGADDERTLGWNTSAFDRYELLPRYLRDVAKVDTATTLLGQRIDVPFFLSPTGMSRLFHHDKEPAAARAADAFGTFYALSTLGTTSLEDIASVTRSPKMFQIYILKDRELTREFVSRCKAAGYEAMCLTVDVPVAGNREREIAYGMRMPPRFRFGSLLSFALHLYWTFNYLRNPDFKLANVAHRVDALGKGGMGLIDYVNSQFDRSVGWKEAEWLVDLWDGPMVIKGLQSVDDARRARDIGARGIMVSNHGGRQLDTAPAPIDCIAEFADAVGDDLDIICDGGVRRGTHIIKALALGAKACSFGRPYLYGLAAGGEVGVMRALSLLRDELTRDMALLGCSSIGEIGPQHLRPHGDVAARTG